MQLSSNRDANRPQLSDCPAQRTNHSISKSIRLIHSSRKLTVRVLSSRLLSFGFMSTERPVLVLGSPCSTSPGLPSILHSSTPHPAWRWPPLPGLSPHPWARAGLLLLQPSQRVLLGEPHKSFCMVPPPLCQVTLPPPVLLTMNHMSRAVFSLHPNLLCPTAC